VEFQGNIVISTSSVVKQVRASREDLSTMIKKGLVIHQQQRKVSQQIKFKGSKVDG